MKKTIFIVLLIVFINQISYSQRNNFIESSGDLLQIGLPTLAFISTFVWKDDSKPEWQFVKAMGTSFLITHGLKRIINKKRPNGGKYSFPSGHTSAAFTGAAFIEKRYGWKAGIPAYLLASYVGYSKFMLKNTIYTM